MRRTLLGLAMLFAIGGAGGAPAAAQDFPTRPITLVVPFAPGGPNDVLARLVTDHMTRSLGQPVVIENVAGAGGRTGSARALSAPADGYTILSGNLGSLAAAYALYKKINYGPGDVAAIGMLAATPNFLVVRNTFPARSLAEFIAYAKANPDTVTVGNAGLGSNAHLVCLYLESLAGIKLRHVPYRGTGPAVNDLVGGQIDGMCDSAPNMVPQIAAGTIRALVLAQPTRIAATPDVPTAAEAGLPGFNIVGWNAIVGPAAMPKATAAKLNAALAAALADPAVKSRIEALGAIPPAPDEASAAWMDRFLKSEAATWDNVIKTAGIKVD